MNTVVIGGITGGIGKALAHLLHKNGYRVCGYARDRQRLASLSASNPGWHIRELDATNADAVKAYFSSLETDVGELHAYCHCVGSVFLKPIHLTSDRDWEAVLHTNLFSAFYATRSAVAAMQKGSGGSIVLCSSVAAVAGLASHEAIAAAKGGINGLVLATAASYANKQIRVNAVAPGLVETPATQLLTANPDSRALSEKMHPLGRLGNAGEIAALMAFLVSAEASWITGQIFSVDGGMGKLLPKPRA